jgi:hypothetical protein
MERRTRYARPALRSLFGPASFGPAGKIEPQRRGLNCQSRNRSVHADRRLGRLRCSRSRRAPRDRRDNHQDDDRRATLSRFPRHVPSLSPHIPTYVKWVLREHSVRREPGLRPPSGGGNRAIHSIEGSATCACKKAKLAASQTVQHLPWRSPGDRPQATGASFFSSRFTRRGLRRAARIPRLVPRDPSP